MFSLLECMLPSSQGVSTSWSAITKSTEWFRWCSNPEGIWPQKISRRSNHSLVVGLAPKHEGHTFSSVFAQNCTFLLKFCEVTHIWHFPREEKCPQLKICIFLSFNLLLDPGIPGVRSKGPSLSHWCCWNLTDVKITGQYQLMMLKGQSKAMWQCKWRHLVTKLVTNASSAIWWPKLLANASGPPWWCKKHQMLATFTSKQVHLVAKTGTNTSEATFKLISVRKNVLSYRVNTMGPLFLWQCFLLRNGKFYIWIKLAKRRCGLQCQKWRCMEHLKAHSRDHYLLIIHWLGVRIDRHNQTIVHFLNSIQKHYFGLASFGSFYFKVKVSQNWLGRFKQCPKGLLGQNHLHSQTAG